MINFIEKIKKFQLGIFENFDVCFDLGTNYTRIAVKNIGVILQEPTIIGYNTKSKSYVFFGQEAKRIIGKIPEFIEIIKPITYGVIANFDAELELLDYLIKNSLSFYLSKYKIIKPRLRAAVTVPICATEIEKRAVEELLIKLNFSDIFLIDKPIANSFGANHNPFSHLPVMIVDLGGGLIEAAILSGGGIVSYKVIKNFEQSLNHNLTNYLYLKHGIMIGENTCEEVRETLLNFNGEDKIYPIRGKALENGLPKTIRLRSSEVKEALATNFIQIKELIIQLIEISPPEVVDDIYNTGIFLTGGLANIAGIDKFLAKDLKITINISEKPKEATILGLLKIINNPSVLKRTLI